MWRKKVTVNHGVAGSRAITHIHITYTVKQFSKAHKKGCTAELLRLSIYSLLCLFQEHLSPINANAGQSLYSLQVTGPEVNLMVHKHHQHPHQQDRWRGMLTFRGALCGESRCTSLYLHQSQLRISVWCAGITIRTPAVFTSQTLRVWSPDRKGRLGQSPHPTWVLSPRASSWQVKWKNATVRILHLDMFENHHNA